MNILTIDTGTTNTRVTVWQDQTPLAHAQRMVGVRDTAITGNRERLSAGVRDTLHDALDKVNLQLDAVDLVLASGMITSNLGLCEVPHLLAPASCHDLAMGMQQAMLPEICPQGIWFVPGVRNVLGAIGLHNFEAMDMMRGEETECMALVERLQICEPAVVVLPGSHSKFVHLDDTQRITGCVTTIAGELLDVITNHTLLAATLDSRFIDSVDAEMLLAGARSAGRIGLGRACFTVRILDQFSVYERNAHANFLLGAILGADLLTLRNSSAIRMQPGTQFVIAGKAQLREALALLVRDDDFFSGCVNVVTDEQQEHLAGYGALRLARSRGLID